MRLLFFDFDGVLHPHDAGDVRDVDGMMEFVSVRDDAPLFCRLPLLIDALRDHQDVRIVISSSWRRLYERHELRAFLGELADRYLAEIPHLAGHNRHDEIVCFIRENELETVPWLALDDDPENFPVSCPNVLWTNPETGIEPESVQQLRRWLAAQDQEGHNNEQ